MVGDGDTHPEERGREGVGDLRDDSRRHNCTDTSIFHEAAGDAISPHLSYHGVRLYCRRVPRACGTRLHIGGDILQRQR